MLANFTTQAVEHFQSLLENALPSAQQEPHRLHEAMRYTMLSGGKRIRPLLVYATGHVMQAEQHNLDACALAVELIHGYSLVHDDLPAMDNDDLRRGQATCHVAYDQATAILVGDSLQSLAFEVLAKHPFTAVKQQQQLQMVTELAKAAGSQGMTGGQMLDLLAENQQISPQALQTIHKLKTGALLTASIKLAALCSPAYDRHAAEQLSLFSHAIGLAFQVKDDILDVEACTETLGKPQGSDAAKNKSTYPAQLGLEGAQTFLHELHQQALQALAQLPYNTALLEQLSDYIVSRNK